MPNETTTTTALADTPMSAADIFRNARELGPFLREQSDAIEAARTLPPAVARRMREAGMFRLAMPKSWGGPEMSTIEINEVIEEVSRANASAGWCIAIGCDSGFSTAFLDDAVARKLYPRLDSVMAGSVTPGRADRVKGGYRINGQWPFASGIKHAEVVMAACLIFENGAPVMDGDVPRVQMMMTPASRVEVLDTWHTTGMRGTGSHDFRAQDLFVPEEHSFRFGGPIRREGALYRHPLNFVQKVFGVPLGMARAMIDDVSAAMQTKVEMPSGRLYKNAARVQTAIAEAEMILGAARAYS
ncbi:MAG TPA: acyl-CoA dehydrogenase family protein, partial [Candidatus Binataceae bacterium]|nr:acyl-CoA dehydrogenase family protein [Candidatus Binataceae bacterium]